MHLVTDALSHWWTICVLTVVGSQLARGQQQSVQTLVANGAVLAQQNAAKIPQPAKTFDEYKRSPLFVEPFDAKVLSLPADQLAFVRNVTRDDMIFYREILHDAIANRNKVGPSVRLVVKYGARLVGNFIKNRRSERQIANRVEPKPEFFLMLANLAQDTMDLSGQLKRNYSKNKIDIEKFRLRTEALFDYVQKIVETSPMGTYMKWNQLVLYKDKPVNDIQNRPVKDEMADLTAVSRRNESGKPARSRQ
jgi:hypothetical protein